MKIFGTITLALVFSSCLWAQNFVEVGPFIGIANYQGDLAQSDIEFRETQYSAGGFVEFHYNRKLHLRAQAFLAKISGDDANGNQNRMVRNWRFTADIMEASIQASILPFGKRRINKVGLFNPQINPYITAGVGLAFTIRKDLDVSESGINLGDLPTGFPEPDDQDNFLVFPIGAGLRFDFTQWTTLAGEISWRYTNSDYLDGVAKNGKEAGPDWYLFFGISLSTYFGEQEDYGL